MRIKLFLQTIYSQPLYIVLAALVTLTFFIISVWLANYSFLHFIFTAGIFDFIDQLKIIFDFTDLISASFTFIPLVITITLSVLFGINSAAIIFFIRNKISISKREGAGFLSSSISFLGVGCLSCGSVIFSSIFGVVAAAAFIGLLPLGGYEFGILGIIILLISIYMLSQKFNNKLICK
jgi:hypothetical protein